MTDEEIEKEARFCTKGWKGQENCILAYISGYKRAIKENSIKLHKQSDTDDIFNACNDQELHCFVCKMKDGSYNIAFGKCVEDNNGMIEPSIYFEYKDSEYYLEDIDTWCEIPVYKEKI